MTIFQKMLFVPILSLFLYASFSVYSYQKHLDSSANIEEIRDAFTPASILIIDTSALFIELKDLLKDTVISGESDWLDSANDIQITITQNLNALSAYQEIIDQENLTALKESFTIFYESSLQFSKLMLKDKGAISSATTLINDIELHYKSTQTLLLRLKEDMQFRFKQTIDQTSQSLSSLLIYSIIISISTMLFIIAMMLVVAISTRKSLNELVIIVKDMALGSSDFSQRITRNSQDELGSVIYWFNKLSDKLEQDYINLETISITDQLTQLNNRTRTDDYFPTAIQEAKQTTQSLIAVLIDIDHFKSVNDNFGHLTGDNVLQEMAIILKEHARQHDFVARWGGEEFIIILPNTSTQEATQHIEALRIKIEQHCFPAVSSITASFGLSRLQDGDTPETLMERADKCLYQAKEEGRNRVVSD